MDLPFRVLGGKPWTILFGTSASHNDPWEVDPWEVIQDHCVSGWCTWSLLAVKYLLIYLDIVTCIYLLAYLLGYICILNKRSRLGLGRGFFSQPRGLHPASTLWSGSYLWGGTSRPYFLGYASKQILADLDSPSSGEDRVCILVKE
jgi:hypothetical protein